MLAIFAAGFVVVCFGSISHCALTDLPLQGKPSSQSSTAKSSRGPLLSASLALDGKPSLTRFFDHSCTHTDTERDPWWKVDLQSTHCLGEITLINRGDCCGERLDDAAVRAGTNDDIYQNGICGSRVTSAQASILGGLTMITCDPPVVAQYVSVDLVGGSEILSLCEVTVKEYPMKECLPKTTTLAPSVAPVTPIGPTFMRNCMSTLVYTETCMDNQPLASTHAASPMSCFMECRCHDNCTSFDYVITSGRCRFFNAEDWKLVQQSDCLMYKVACGLPKQKCT
ncbi:fucolectin-like [Asterias rubens]|uniref:fucolectin-like n=1 Tax=Asterias rubens TaxID=7604 RepID=UPI0014550114|nr:fucolectin-like [Asterias rubens]